MYFKIIILIIFSFFIFSFAVSPVRSPLRPVDKSLVIRDLEILKSLNPPTPRRETVKYQLQASKNGKLYRPVVLMHGIRGDITSMVDVEEWIKEKLPGIYVRRIQVGNGYWDSILMPMNEQVQDFCQQIQQDPNLQNGFNLVGFSQGTLVTRGFIQRCNNPSVYNYISWAGPQGGLFGIPFIGNQFLDEYLGSFPYWDYVQRSLAPAQFWKDPYDMSTYYNVSLYLPDINNELPIKNETYKKHITSLNHMVLLYSINDDIINPKESGWFWFYKPNTMELVPVKETPFFSRRLDWIENIR